MLGLFQILRIYSLVDLALLMYVVGTDGQQLMGTLCLWVSFLLLLEWQHQHDYRPTIRACTWISLGVGGMALLWSWWGVVFLLLGYLYTKKERGYWGVVSPFIRGLQTIALVLATGSGIKAAFIAAVAIGIRNLLGDVRDAAKDNKVGMNTLPVLLGLRRNIPHLHLAATCGTTALWAFALGEVEWWVVVLFWAIQTATYHLTPR